MERLKTDRLKNPQILIYVMDLYVETKVKIYKTITKPENDTTLYTS